MDKDFYIAPSEKISETEFTKSDIKVITNALEAKEDEPYKYLYILDLRNEPCKALMGSVYPWFCLWNGTELLKNKHAVQPDICKDLFGEYFNVKSNFNRYNNGDKEQ